jgi:YHS domain-containing protein
MRRMILLSLLLMTFTAAADETVNKTLFGNAVKGYDVVAYFTDGKPVEGSSDHEVEWNGATWRFASAQHKSLFAKEPAKYAPQYGGFCAFGVSRGYAVGIDPEAWKIVGGKLYLNYNRDVQTEGVKDIPGYIAKADANWPKIVAEKKKE